MKSTSHKSPFIVYIHGYCCREIFAGRTVAAGHEGISDGLCRRCLPKELVRLGWASPRQTRSGFPQNPIKEKTWS